MSAMPMLAEGTIVVLDDNDALDENHKDRIIGFVFVEPLAKPQGSQLQRWILREIRKQYRFRSPTANEGAPASLSAWKQMVLTPKPARATWGAIPSQGLWVAGATYVVAQATPVIPAAGVVPTPTFPRRQAIIAHTLASATPPSPPPRVGLASPVADMQQRPTYTPQIVIGDYVLRQLGEARGYCFGDLVVQSHEKATFFESSEYALLGPGYLGAGSANAGTTRLDASKSVHQQASQFHAFVMEGYVPGARYEVIGCNYYHGAGHPPEWFL